jgi:hypothetical protein
VAVCLRRVDVVVLQTQRLILAIGDVTAIAGLMTAKNPMW